MFVSNLVPHRSRIHIIYLLYRDKGSYIFHDIIDGTMVEILTTERDRTKSAGPSSEYQI